MQTSENSDGNGDELIDSIAVDVAQMNQETDAQVGTRRAANCERQHHLAPHCAFAQVNRTGADLGDKVEERVRADGANGRHVPNRK